MIKLTAEQQKVFNNYKKSHPKVSDEKIISALVQTGQITLTEDQKNSILTSQNNKFNDYNSGLKLEKTTTPSNNGEKVVFLQSGRKVVVTKTKDGKDVYKYYAADGKQLAPDYFKKQEGTIRISADGSSYTATKDGKTVTKKTKDPLTAKLDQQQAQLNKTKKEQGFLGKSWDWFKNTTGIGDGSDKAQKQIDAERALVQQVKSGKVDAKKFKEVTGVEYTKENAEKFKTGNIELKSTEKIKGYEEGQEMATDMAADMTAGIAAFGIYTAAVAAAPFTGGASIAVGVVAASGSAALIKSGIKYADAKSAGREYTAKEFKKDAFTGSISGVLAPVTAGFGGAVGKGVAVKVGGKVIATEMAEVAGKDVAQQGFMQTFKGLMLKPGSIKLATETVVKDGVAKEVTIGGTKASAGFFLGEAATSGAAWGGIDGAARTTYDQVESGEGLDGGAIAMSAVEGTVGGAVAGVGFGGAMKGIGKLWGKVFGRGKANAKVETKVETEPKPEHLPTETPKPKAEVVEGVKPEQPKVHNAEAKPDVVAEASSQVENVTTSQNVAQVKQQPRKFSFGTAKKDGTTVKLDNFKNKDMKIVDVTLKENLSVENGHWSDLPAEYKMTNNEGKVVLKKSIEIDTLEALEPHNGAGTKTIQEIIAYANEHAEGRLFCLAAKSEGKDSPLLFYYKNGLRSDKEEINIILEKVLKGELPKSAIPESSLMYLPPKETKINFSVKQNDVIGTTKEQPVIHSAEKSKTDIVGNSEEQSLIHTAKKTKTNVVDDIVEVEPNEIVGSKIIPNEGKNTPKTEHGLKYKILSKEEVFETEKGLYPKAADFILENKLSKEIHLEEMDLILHGNKDNLTLKALTSEQKQLLAQLLKITNNGGKELNNPHAINLALQQITSNSTDELVHLIQTFKVASSKDLGHVLKAFINSKNNDMKQFILSNGYMKLLTDNSAGKYQKELLEMFKPENMTGDLLEKMLSSDLSLKDFLSSIKKLSKSTFKLAYDTPNQYLSDIDVRYTRPVNGKLPKLTDEELNFQRREICEFFKDNLVSLTRALKYLDTDTVSHMMDRRTTLFRQQLIDLNQLSDKNYELYSLLTKLKSAKTGKQLSPRDKIQLGQIVKIYQDAKLDMNILEKAVKEGKIDLDLPKQRIQEAVLERAGVNLNEVSTNNIPFNSEYSYLALKDSSEEIQRGLAEFRRNISQGLQLLRNNKEALKNHIKTTEEQLNNPNVLRMASKEQIRIGKELLEMFKHIDDYSDDQIISKMMSSVKVELEKMSNQDELKTVIRAAATGDFNKFITNAENIYGQANLRTQEAFRNIGLNYENWLKPDIAPTKLQVAGKDMTLQIWDRVPQEDLFMGNKTTCCTAIGTGGNAAATPVYLLNTSYNVVFLRDAQDNVVGMSRVFMSQIDGKPSLIMDNIELNKTYIKGMSESELTELRNGFFEYMNKYSEVVTGNKDSQVYFYSGDIHVPSGDLAHKQAVTSFVGDLSQENVYVNASGCRWINPKKMNEIGEIDWLVVPKDNQPIGTGKHSEMTFTSTEKVGTQKILDTPIEKPIFTSIKETPIQIQERLLKELETAKTREDFARITQEIKNLPKTAEYNEARQSLGVAHMKKYNEWKANQPESTRAIVNKYEESSIQQEKSTSKPTSTKKTSKPKLTKEQEYMIEAQMDLINKRIKNELKGEETEKAKYILENLKDRLFNHSKKDYMTMEVDPEQIIKLAKMQNFNKERFELLLSLEQNADSYYPLGHSITKIMSLSENDFAKIQNILGDNKHNISLLTICSDVKSENIDRLNLFIKDSNLLDRVQKHLLQVPEICNLPENDWQNLIKRDIIGKTVNNDGMYGEAMANLAKLTDKEWQIVEKRGLYKCSRQGVVKTIIELSDEKFDKLIKLKLYNPETGEIKIGKSKLITSYLELTPQQIEKLEKYRLLERRNKGISSIFSKDNNLEFMKLPDATIEEWNKKGLFDYKIGDRLLTLNEINDLAEFDKEMIQTLVTKILPLSKNMTVKQAIEFSSLSEEALAKVAKFNLFEEVIAKRPLEHDGKGSLTLFLSNLRNDPNEEIKLNFSEVMELIKLDDNQIPMALKFMKNANVEKYHLTSISKMSKLNKEDFALVEKMFTEKPENSYIIERCLKENGDNVYFDKTTYNQIKKLMPLIDSEPEAMASQIMKAFEGKNGIHDTDASSEFINLCKLLKSDKNFEKQSLTRFIDYTIKNSVDDIKAKANIYKLLKEYPSIPIEDKNVLISISNETTTDLVNQAILLSKEDANVYNTAINILKNVDFAGFELIKGSNLKRIIEKIEIQKSLVLKDPDKYINGEIKDANELIQHINYFFDSHIGDFALLSELFDKEALNNLLRMRFTDTAEYMSVVRKFKPNELKLLSDLCKSTNIDNKPFMPTQKIEFIDLIRAYTQNNLSLNKMESMLNDGKINLAELHIDLFHGILKNSGLSETEIAKIPNEKLLAWDTSYAHLLSKEINESEDEAFRHIIRAANLDDFEKYIHNPENVYGISNANTKRMYDEMNMDYDAWIHPSKDAEVRFFAKDKNTEQLLQISKQIIEDIDVLRATPVKGFIDKQFPKCIKNGEFVIPTEYVNSKAKLQEFTNSIIKQLDSVWKRAEGNANNPDPKRAATARNTLTILNHFKQRLEAISKITDSETKTTKTLDLTIKMWDRNPQKDIFQGNYSTCCIGMGGGNGSAMPHYVMNTSFNMVELVDNTNNRTIGNALCYFIKDADGRPAFVFDNVEINTSIKPSDEAGKDLRNSLIAYAENISKNVTGRDDIRIYIGKQYNDIPYKDLVYEKHNMSFVGDVDCESIYLDVYGDIIEDSWVPKNMFAGAHELGILK